MLEQIPFHTLSDRQLVDKKRSLDSTNTECYNLKNVYIAVGVITTVLLVLLAALAQSNYTVFVIAYVGIVSWMSGLYIRETLKISKNSIAIRHTIDQMVQRIKSISNTHQNAHQSSNVLTAILQRQFVNYQVSVKIYYDNLAPQIHVRFVHKTLCVCLTRRFKCVDQQQTVELFEILSFICTQGLTTGTQPTFDEERLMLLRFFDSNVLKDFNVLYDPDQRPNSNIIKQTLPHAT